MLKKLIPNYDQVCAKIEHLPYNEARRIRGPVYDAMITELQEHGCWISAKHFRCLAKKEEYLFEIGAVSSRISENFDLLTEIFSKIKRAEILMRNKECKSTLPAFQLYYEVLLLLEPESKYDWLFRDVFQIICDVSDVTMKKDDTPKEAVARIYFKFGTYLTKTNELHLASVYMTKALELSRAEFWSADVSETKWDIMHQIVGRDLANVLLKYSRQQVQFNLGKAIKAIENAVLVISEVGIKNNYRLHCDSNLLLAKYLVQDCNFVKASKVLDKIDDALRLGLTVDNVKLSCKSALLRGICLTNLHEPTRAYRKLKQALTVSRIYGMKYTEADVLLYLGKLHSLNPVESLLAARAYNSARALYTQLGDANNKVKAVYLLAKLKSDDIFPYLMDMLKSTNQDLCNFYRLRQWKNLCQPFWTSMSDDQQKQLVDKNYCVVEKLVLSRGSALPSKYEYS